MKRCTPADKRVKALIISCAMLASTFSMGAAFAEEETDNGTEYAAPTGVTQDENTDVQKKDIPGAADGSGEPLPAENNGSGTEPAETEESQDGGTGHSGDTLNRAGGTGNADSAKTVGTQTQPFRMVLENGTKRTLLKPDTYGRYIYNSSISSLRGSKTIKVLISNPAVCSMTYTGSSVASNANGKFLETKLIGRTVDDAAKINVIKAAVTAAGGRMDELDYREEHPESAGAGTETGTVDPYAIQVTEIEIKIKGTGEASISFTSAKGDCYSQVKGSILIRQTRPTSVIKRSATVRNKSMTPKSIQRSYKEQYFTIVKDGDNEKAEYKYRTVKGAFEIKRASGVSESGYRATQGGNTDGTYAYTAMGKKGSKTYNKVVKTRLSDMKVVKVSGDLKLDHANDITYDPVNKRIVVTHNDRHRKRVSFVNPGTLKLTGYKDIVVPATLKGATKAQLSAIKGFASVTYMRSGKYAGNYIAVISSNHNFLVLNKNFTPIEYITVSKRYTNDQIYYQGADNIDGCLYVGIFPKNQKYKNFICIYDMDGNFKGKITLIKGYELENVFHAGDSIYMTLYKRVTKVWYTPKSVKKKVKLTKEEKALPKYKNKKYKTVIKIVREKHSKVVKRSYIFKMKKVTL